MKSLFIAAALFALAVPSSAQIQCGLPGVTANATPNPAPVGSPIQVTLTNNTNTGINLPSSCVISSVSAGGSCTGPLIFAPLCLQVITPIGPGQSRSQDWFQTDNFGTQVLPGTYSIEIRYWDSNFTVLSSCCVTVDIGTGPGTAYCSSSSLGPPCPCGNQGASGEGCRNSTGAGSILSGSGQAIIGNDTVVLEATQAPANVPGLFFSGPGQLANLPFGDGFRCVSGPIQRLGVIPTNAVGTAQTPWTLSVLQGLVAGDLRHYQYWYRDVGGPCNSGFNTTNGYSIQW